MKIWGGACRRSNARAFDVTGFAFNLVKIINLRDNSPHPQFPPALTIHCRWRHFSVKPSSIYSWSIEPLSVLHLVAAYFSPIAAKTAKTKEFMFQNVAYTPTVFKTGV
jgi:hypothetical protein